MATTNDTINALAICLQTGIVPFVLGSPGIGKSAITNIISRKFGWEADTLLPALREPTDFAGLPVIINGAVVLAAPQWARDAIAGVERNGGHLIIYDEVTCAPPAVQAALLRVILEGVVGDIRMPKEVRQIMVGNPPEFSAGGWDIAAPLMNRVCRLDWALDAEAWGDYMLTRKDDLNVNLYHLPKTWWEDHGRGASSIVVSFVHHRNELRNKPPKADSDPLEPYPTPRSWDMVSKVLAGCMSLGLRPDADTPLVLIAGLVGSGPALEFATWAGKQDLPDPKELLKNPEKLQIDPKRNDRTYVILSSVAAEAVGDPDPKQWVQGWKVLGRAADLGAMDVAAAVARTLARNQPKGTTPPPEVAKFASLLKAIKGK
jgi:hypothetical protein